MRYHGNNICPDERTKETTAAVGLPENIIHSPTLSGSVDIKKTKISLD